MLFKVCNLVVRSLDFFDPFFVFLKSRSLVFISFFNLPFIHGGLSQFDAFLWGICDSTASFRAALSLFQSSFEVMVSRLVSIYSRVLSSFLSIPYPVGFPIDEESTLGLGVFLGAYINFNENDSVVGCFQSDGEFIPDPRRQRKHVCPS